MHAPPKSLLIEDHPGYQYKSEHFCKKRPVAKRHSAYLAFESNFSDNQGSACSPLCREIMGLARCKLNLLDSLIPMVESGEFCKGRLLNASRVLTLNWGNFRDLTIEELENKEYCFNIALTIRTAQLRAMLFCVTSYFLLQILREKVNDPFTYFLRT